MVETCAPDTKRHGITLKQDGSNVIIDKVLENGPKDLFSGDTLLVRVHLPRFHFRSDYVNTTC
jgi:hypothetical protein